MDIRTLRKTVRTMVEPVIQHMGFDLVAVEIVAGVRRQTLRLSIDLPDGGVGADDCAAVSTQVSPLLDAADPIPGAYDLEVSSPGIDRPLQRPEDFARFSGYKARIRLEPGPSRRRFAGPLRGVDGDLVRIEVDGEVYELAMDDIEAAHLSLDTAEYEQLAHGLPPIPSEALAEPLSQNTALDATEEAP